LLRQADGDESRYANHDQGDVQGEHRSHVEILSRHERTARASARTLRIGRDALTPSSFPRSRAFTLRSVIVTRPIGLTLSTGSRSDSSYLLPTGVPESAENEEHEQDDHDDPEDGHWFLPVVDQYE